MKKFLLFLLSLFLTFAIAYSFVAVLSVYKEGYAWQSSASVCGGVIAVSLLYYFWLAQTKRIGKIMIVFYIPATFILFILFALTIMSPPWVRHVTFDMGPDPFSPKTTIGTTIPFLIFEKEFWSKKAQEEYHQELLEEMEATR